MNRNISRESVTTDDGYSSDTKSPSKSSYETENREFKDKYLVEKLLNNSANGVIYTGIVDLVQAQTNNNLSKEPASLT